MTDDFQPGHHPDADQLSAFAEDALPVHERQLTLAHLADCAHCRSVVALALPPLEDALQPQFVSVRKPWFASWKFALPTLGFAAAIALIVFAAHRHNVLPADSTTTIAKNESPKLEPLAPPSATFAPNAPPPPAEKRPSANNAKPMVPLSAAVSSDSVASAASGTAILDTQSITDLPINGRNAVVLNQGLGNGKAAGIAQRSTLNAPLPQAAAAVSLGNAAAIAAPAPPPSASPLPATVEVAADAVMLETSPVTSAEVVASPLLTLPGHRTVASTISRDNQTLALDTAGALFVTLDGGRHWKSIASQWQGRAVKLTVASYPPLPAVGRGAPSGIYAARSSAAIGGPLTAGARAYGIQADAAAITGTVTDATGAVLAGAILQLKNANAKLVRSIKTDASGSYALSGLAPGTYQLEAFLQGFTASRTVTTLTVAQQLSLNLTLTVGSASETVSVAAAAAPPLEVQSAPRKRSLAKTAAPKVSPSVVAPLTAFELTTESGDKWTSTDGQNWSHR